MTEKVNIGPAKGMKGMYSKQEKPAVSIFCTVYNHENYIGRCLEGFVSQKTDFRYEVLVHDDHSSDGSAEIIRSYAERYPDIIRPILQQENQLSKGVVIMDDVLFPLSQGRYIALCEGDDYWCDDLKLQRQYDYMETHPGCSMCVHNTVRHDLEGMLADQMFNDWNDIHVMSSYDAFFGWSVHTSAFFFRREYAVRPDYARKYWFGDYVRLLLTFDGGEVVCLPQAMSVYNSHNHAGVTWQNENSGTDHHTRRYMQMINFLMEFDEHTDKRHHEIIEMRVAETEYAIETEKMRDLLYANSADKKEIISCAQKLASGRYAAEQIRQKRGIRKLIRWYRYHGYQYGYGLWEKLIRRCFPPT